MLEDEHGGSLRTGTRHDIQAFLDIVGSSESPRTLVGPDFPDQLDVDYFLQMQLRLPFGILGYRNALVVDIEGDVAGFLIRLPLLHVKGFLGTVMPEDLARRRYGDLAAVLCLNMIGVAPAHRRKKIATRLYAKAVEEARKQRYKFLVGQTWFRNTASIKALINFGFVEAYARTYQLGAEQEDRFIVFDYKIPALES